MAKKEVKKQVKKEVETKTPKISMATTDDVMCIHRRIDRIVTALGKSKSVRGL